MRHRLMADRPIGAQREATCRHSLRLCMQTMQHLCDRIVLFVRSADDAGSDCSRNSFVTLLSDTQSRSHAKTKGQTHVRVLPCQCCNTIGFTNTVYRSSTSSERHQHLACPKSANCDLRVTELLHCEIISVCVKHACHDCGLTTQLACRDCASRCNSVTSRSCSTKSRQTQRAGL